MPGKPIDVAFPLAGEKRSLAYQSQAPYSSPRLLNCWPRDPIEGRMRGGSRPGLDRAFPQQTSAPIHLLANVRVVETTGETTFLDDFNHALGGYWRTASWKTAAPVVDSSGGWAYSFVQADNFAVDTGVVLNSLQIDTAEQSVVSLSILSDYDVGRIGGRGAASGIYSVFAQLNDTAPNLPVDGVEAQFDASTVPYPTLRLIFYAASVKTEYTAILLPITAYNYPGTLSLTVRASNSCTAEMSFPGGANVNITQTGGSAAGQRFGFGISGPTVTVTPPYIRRVDWFKVVYTGTPPAPNRNIVCVVGGTNASVVSANKAYFQFEDTPGVLSEPPAHTITNTNARQLQAVELLGRLYVVGEAEGIWQFNPKGSGFLVLLSASADADYPFVSGTVPSDCTSIAAWRNRLCVVTRDDPQNCSMSRVGVPGNWSYASIPVGSAVQLNTTGVDTGKVGEPINALIAHSDDYLVLGCLNSIYVLRGDPTYGGQIDRLSASIGVTAPQSWARGPNGETVFLSSDGLYALPAGVLAYPESVSREQLPNELRDIDVNNYRILMGYDVRNRGVFIALTPVLGSGGTYFWFDWETRRFFPMEFDPAFEPTALAYRNADSPIDQIMMLGCRDGYIRAFNTRVLNDDGVDFSTEVMIGPINLGGGGYYDGMILEVIGQTGVGSSDVTLSVQTGKSAEDAFAATPRFSRTLRAGKNITFRPQLRGNACFVKLATTSGRWAFENLTLVRERLGKQRL